MASRNTRYACWQSVISLSNQIHARVALSNFHVISGLHTQFLQRIDMRSDGPFTKLASTAFVQRVCFLTSNKRSQKQLRFGYKVLGNRQAVMHSLLGC